MASPVPSPRVEISDLMEATFWEANKLKFGAVLGVVVVGVLAWQGWKSHQESKQEAGWNALLDPSTMAVREDLALTPEIENSSAAPWARLALARKAFQDQDYSRAEALLSELRTRGELAGLDHDGTVSALAADAGSEMAFRSAHPELPATSPDSSQPQFEITTDAGAITIRPFGGASSNLSEPFMAALREGKLVGLTFHSVMEGQELSADLDAATFATVQDPWTGLRRGGGLSNREGTVAIRLVQPTNTDEKTTYNLVLNLSDNGMRDSDSVVVAVISSGLEVLKTVSERETDDSGKLKEGLKFTAVAERS